MRSLPASLLLAALAAAPAAAQNLLEALEASLRIETRLFDAELERYDELRARELEALQALRQRSDELDRVLKRDRARLQQLERLEVALTQAREAAFAASSRLASQREQLYRRMAKLAEIEAELELERGRQLIAPSRLDGFWELELAPTEEVGLLKLRVEGTLITGTYRLSGGHRGSVRGTLAANRVHLERIDDANGLDSVLEGQYNPANGRIRGRWTAVDLSGGRQGGGTWTARKLTPAEELRIAPGRAPETADEPNI